MKRLVVVLLLPLLMLHGVLPGSGLACAAEGEHDAGAGEQAALTHHAGGHHHGGDAVLTSVSAEPGAVSQPGEAPPGGHEREHCLMAICIAPALASPAHEGQAPRVLTLLMVPAPSGAPRSAVTAPETPPPRA